VWDLFWASVTYNAHALSKKTNCWLSCLSLTIIVLLLFTGGLITDKSTGTIGVAVAKWLEQLTENWETGVQSPVWAKSLTPRFALINHF